MGTSLDRVYGMAYGGEVKHFRKGGVNDLADEYDMDGMELAATDTVPNPFISNRQDFIGDVAENKPITKGPFSNTPVNASNFVTPNVPVLTRSPAAPATPAAPAARPGTPIAALLDKYFAGGEDYGSELQAARQKSATETEAFTRLLEKAMAGSAEDMPSKSELYFRLAEAFGSPTKTGHISENISKAAGVFGEHAKETRAAKLAQRNLGLQLGIEAQKMRMQGAKEELGALRALAAEGMKDKRTIATELIKEYVKSGQPESSAGKQAKDEGLTPGTPEFQNRVSKIAEMNVEKQLQQINALMGNLSVAQANLALQQGKFDFTKTQAGKLTAGEVKLKTEAEDALSKVDSAMGLIKKAYSLNPNTFDTSLADIAQRKVLEAAGSKDQKVVNTRELENLLKSEMITSAKDKMSGVLSDSDIKLLQSIQGIDAKSVEERAKILKNVYSTLKQNKERHQKRLNEINQGLYRETTSEDLK